MLFHVGMQLDLLRDGDMWLVCGEPMTREQAVAATCEGLVKLIEAGSGKAARYPVLKVVEVDRELRAITCKCEDVE